MEGITCEHNRTVHIFASVYKCSECGELTDTKNEELQPDVEHYKRSRERRENARQRAIQKWRDAR